MGDTYVLILCNFPYLKSINTGVKITKKKRHELINFVSPQQNVHNLDAIPLNIIVFTSRQYNRHICNILDDLGLIEKRIIIWARKRGFNNTRGKALASGYEPICYYSKTDNGTFNNIKVKNFKTDGANEYKSKKVIDYCKQNGIYKSISTDGK